LPLLSVSAVAEGFILNASNPLSTDGDASVSRHWRFWFNARLLTVLLQGFASGLPIALCSTALQAWFTISHVGLVSIGLLGLVGQPYVYKFMWAPLLDRFSLPGLDRRRGWILVMQLLLITSLWLMSFGNPLVSPWFLAILGFVVAMFSATQDTAIDAYRTDLLKPDERGIGAGYAVTGYRIAMLVSGGLALVIADHIGWSSTYRLMAGFMLIGVLASLFGPKLTVRARAPQTVCMAFVVPIKDLFSKYPLGLLLLCIILYKLSDAMALSMTTTFLLRGLAFSQSDVGVAFKVFGMAATLLGLFIGGGLMPRLGLYRSLCYFGLFQATANLLFALLAWVGHQFVLMATVIFIEQLASGMGTAAFLAFLMGLCNPNYTATQFALLSAASAVGRVFISPVAGVVATQLGWFDFYVCSFLIGLPGIAAIMYFRRYYHFGDELYAAT